MLCGCVGLNLLAEVVVKRIPHAVVLRNPTCTYLVREMFYCVPRPCCCRYLCCYWVFSFIGCAHHAHRTCAWWHPAHLCPYILITFGVHCAGFSVKREIFIFDTRSRKSLWSMCACMLWMGTSLVFHSPWVQNKAYTVYILYFISSILKWLFCEEPLLKMYCSVKNQSRYHSMKNRL